MKYPRRSDVAAWYVHGRTTEVLLVIDVAERHRGGDPLPRYLRKLSRTMGDMLAGRPVRAWRLDCLRTFFEDLADTSLRAVPRGGGCF